MRVFDQGCFYTVQVTRREVMGFKKTWPCSGLPDKAISFTFDKKTGDLVDTTYVEKDWSDGQAALALCSMAQEYAAKRLGL